MSGSVNKTLDKFRGCLLGSLIGDCLGAPVECEFWSGISDSKVLKQFESYKKAERKKFYKYTDDTAMARQVAISLIKNQSCNLPDMAQRFTESYLEEPWRGYGSNVANVFHSLKQDETYLKDPFGPASRQFDGSGSYGNGGGMRIHPLGLFHLKSSADKVVNDAEDIAKITHAHPEGIAGSVYQALAVHGALHGLSNPKILESLDKAVLKSSTQETKTIYDQKYQNLRTLLREPSFIDAKDDDDDEDDESFIGLLGNDISAARSVPTALFCFMKAQKDYECRHFENVTNEFEKSLMLAMKFGGDTDTIMAMTGAIAGAYYGESKIPKYLFNNIENVNEIRNYADKLYEIAESS